MYNRDIEEMDEVCTFYGRLICVCGVIAFVAVVVCLLIAGYHIGDFVWTFFTTL